MIKKMTNKRKNKTKNFYTKKISVKLYMKNSIHKYLYMIYKKTLLKKLNQKTITIL